MAIPAAETFLRWGEYLTGRIRWATGTLGRRAVGYVALLNDQIAEGMRQAFYASLPGHPEQARDSLDVTGHSRDLILYPGETTQVWADRVHNAWEDYEQGGTPQVVLKGVDDWGIATFPEGFWDSNAYITEERWARFQVVIPYGNVTDETTFAWTPAYDYGTGRVYGPAQDYSTDAVVYGMSYFSASEDIVPIALDIDLLRRTVRKWKPARSKATVRVVLDATSHYYGEPGLTYFSPEYFFGSIATREGAGNLTIPYPTGTDIEVGDLLVLHEGRNSLSDSPPAGWTQLTDSPGSFHRSTIFVKIADGTETGSLIYSVTGAGNHVARMICIKSPPNGWNPTVLSNFHNIETFTSLGDLTIDTPENTENEHMLYFLGVDYFDVEISSTTPPFWTERYDSQGNLNLMFYSSFGPMSSVEHTLSTGSPDVSWNAFNLILDQVAYAEGNFLDVKV